MKIADEEKWDLVVHDCSNNTKLARDLNLSSKEGKWFGASNYACEFSRIPYEVFLPILRDDNFKYSEGNIIETYSQGNSEYIFQVQGSEDYEVVVKIDDQREIIYSECDCPYDFGPICKHQVAAYFELLEIMNSRDNKLLVKSEVAKLPEMKEVLNNLSKEELIKVIVDITQKDTKDSR